MPTPRPRSRNDGTIAWQVPYSVYEYGRRRQSSETFDTQQDAARWAALVECIGAEEALKILDAQLGAPFEHATITDWLRRYADRLTGIQEDSRRKYHRFIDNDIDPFMGYLPIEAFTQDTDAAFVVHLEQDKGNAPKTIHNKHGFLSAGMRAAVEQRPTPLIPFTPCAATRLPRVDAPEIEIFAPAVLRSPGSHSAEGISTRAQAGRTSRSNGKCNIADSWKRAISSTRELSLLRTRWLIALLGNTVNRVNQILRGYSVGSSRTSI